MQLAHVVPEVLLHKLEDQGDRAVDVGHIKKQKISKNNLTAPVHGAPMIVDFQTAMTMAALSILPVQEEYDTFWPRFGVAPETLDLF